MMSHKLKPGRSTGQRAASSQQLRVVVLGYIVRRPLGGGTWPTLQWALGLKKLGHDVTFLEDSEDYPACYDPTRHVTDRDATYGLHYARRVFDRVGLGDRWAYYDAHQDQWHGPRGHKAIEICRSADLLINVSGINPIRPWMLEVPRRIYLDTDPAFEQARFHTDQGRKKRVLDHNLFFTLGENIPSKLAKVPQTSLPWKATRQPVVMDCWPQTQGSVKNPLTTVMLWDSYPCREYQNFRFGMKSESFEPYLDLPSKTEASLEMALGSPTAPRRMLRDKGWSVVDPLGVTRDPWTYQRYLAHSSGEFTVAKHGYVVSECGWFSERSAHYLASGRPVITQETGFSSWLPTGSGLFSHRTPEEALSAIDQLRSRYHHHCEAARDLAQEHFNSDTVLSSLVERAMQEAVV